MSPRDVETGCTIRIGVWPVTAYSHNATRFSTYRMNKGKLTTMDPELYEGSQLKVSRYHLRSVCRGS